MVFGWLRPEEEPEDSSLVEISDDNGTHIVVNTPTQDDALDVEGWTRRGAGARSDRDEALSQERRAERQYDYRDHYELRVRSGRVVDNHEDLEPEVDDDSVTEANEQAAEGGWFSWW
ncbi:MAG: hypothetical protein V2I45_12735 [Halieaceae bacterium]|jgi:hypothetical protein|nr:hypothetical protein [Halieaceae bacterium]